MEQQNSMNNVKRTLFLGILVPLLLLAAVPATVHFEDQHQFWLAVPIAKASEITRDSDRSSFYASNDTAPLHLEAEDGNGDGQVMARSNASGELTVLLQSSESRTLAFSSPSQCEIKYGISVQYSNDHDRSQPLETVMVGIDGEPIGQFEAENTKLPGQSPGTGWNQFNSSGQLGISVLEPGDHEVTISVSDGDGLGVEIDVVLLEIIEQDCNLFLPLVTRSAPPINLEGENGSCDEPVIERSNASNGYTILLVSGRFCQWIAESESSHYTIEIRYSNDQDESDPLETVTVLVDGEKVGQFQAANTRPPGQDSGAGWNEFRSSGPIETDMLVAGSHEIIVLVSHGDDFGLEIDTVMLKPASAPQFQR